MVHVRVKLKSTIFGMQLRHLPIFMNYVNPYCCGYNATTSHTHILYIQTLYTKPFIENNEKSHANYLYIVKDIEIVFRMRNTIMNVIGTNRIHIDSVFTPLVLPNFDFYNRINVLNILILFYVKLNLYFGFNYDTN